MDIKNLPRARTTIDIVWAYFWCDPARFSLVVVLRQGGHDGSGKAEEKLFDQQTQRFPSHVMHVLHHNLLGELHLLEQVEPDFPKKVIIFK